MRDAETILSIIHDRGQRGLSLEDLYRQLFNPALYLRAYARIGRNEGALTPGVTTETVDGMSLDRMEALIDDVRHERHRWTPVRRTYIPKKSGKKRPLGIPVWKDKLLQEVMRSLLEAYYEPQFSVHSHGFRPGKGCHTALTEIYQTWKGTKWFVEGDIKGCFDNIDHQVMLSILREKIHDNRFIRLVDHLLQAGYLEEWTYHPTLSGTPQGGVISPILANIYLDQLDKYVEQELLPAHNRGKERKRPRDYRRVQMRRLYCLKQGWLDEAKALTQEMRNMPSRDPNDPDFRRLHYVRYADDFLLGFAGPQREAEEIREKLREFLDRKLKLELSPEKTLITHAASEAARFLGYEIVTRHCDTQLFGKDRERNINGSIGLRLPADTLEARCNLYQRNGKPIHRPELVNDSDFSAVARYQVEYRGFVQYYALALNIRWLDKLRWIMETSLLKTLASKHKTSVQKMAKQLKSTVETHDGPRKCLEVTMQREGKKPLVARFGGICLRRKKQATLVDHPARITRHPETNELLKRLLAEECELCGTTEKVEVHHIRKLADLKEKGRKKKPLWVQVMAQRRRKTLVLCEDCHDEIHAGTSKRQLRTE